MDIHDKKIIKKRIIFNNSKKIYIKLSNNDTLLISEKSNKVFLPYTAKEIKEILKNNSNYKTSRQVIKKFYTRSFFDYKFQYFSRYKETMKLAREREKFCLTDSISLALEMMRKRYLHPAIISACRTLNELDVYIDCLDKNELDDFKIFQIKYMNVLDCFKIIR